jgi:site-specific DNA recombinase
MAENVGHQATTPAKVQKFATTARERIRIDGGGCRREHLRESAQRIEFTDGEVRIIGARGDLLRTMAAGSDAKSATPDVRSSVPNWRRGRDSNPRNACTFNGFRDRPDRPLWHLSSDARARACRVGGVT